MSGPDAALSKPNSVEESLKTKEGTIALIKNTMEKWKKVPRKESRE